MKILKIIIDILKYDKIYDINNFQNLCNIFITRNLRCIADILTRQGIKIISLTPDKNVWIANKTIFLFP